MGRRFLDHFKYLGHEDGRIPGTWPGVAEDHDVQLEVLDAQVSLTRARFNAVSALAECNTALAMWLRSRERVTRRDAT
jgi:hypothetical protein